MNIAVASDDQVKIANHFGRTRGFLIFTVEENKIVGRKYIENNFTGHVQGQHHDHSGEHHHHSHKGILDALTECKVVISRGMGRRLLEDFDAVGKQVFITHVENADEAVKQYLDGNLFHDPDKSCQH